MIILYRIYQLLIMAPLMIVVTVLASVVTIIGTTVFGTPGWGYYPAKYWARCMAWLTLVRVTVSGRENIQKGQSYVFVANHQGAYDIFAIYGWLNHSFRWMMKASLRRIPLVGFACYRAGQIFVDKSSPSAIRATMQKAERQLANGGSVVVFPEGSRTYDGSVGRFRRGAYLLAEEFGLPVVPVTIDGAFAVMPRTARLPRPGHVHLTIHAPILPEADGTHDMAALIEASRNAIVTSLEN